uniref:Apple domain-containing protein n=1 Tax=Marseillevirus LCMAC102 TaxID=2506603 RepID=A0A481YTM1_9VIRU|nr:MAG: hypothetical protein LCMAC102_00720 [Marseillevirus LCMAC102]
MDCVRVSTKEHNNGFYEGDYKDILGLEGADLSACRQACITDLDCMAWKYTLDQKCQLADKLPGKSPVLISTEFVTKGGLIECKGDWNMLHLIWWVVILGLALVGVWYVLNRCPHRKK